MLVLEMFDILVFSLEQLGALLPMLVEMREVTAPTLRLRVLGDLMPLPVSFASKLFVALWECTAIWPLVAFHMLSVQCSAMSA